MRVLNPEDCAPSCRRSLWSTRLVTPNTNLEQGSADLEEEFSHASRNNVASPPSYNGRPGHVAGSIGVQFLKDDMSYPYPKYSNHPNARSHVKQFQSIWTVNHEIQGLSAANAEQSKIVDVQLSLEGQAARWYAQQDIVSFHSFDDVAAKFKNFSRSSSTPQKCSGSITP